jgi:hypothetical protein
MLNGVLGLGKCYYEYKGRIACKYYGVVAAWSLLCYELLAKQAIDPDWLQFQSLTVVF